MSFLIPKRTKEKIGEKIVTGFFNSLKRGHLKSQEDILEERLEGLYQRAKLNKDKKKSTIQIGEEYPQYQCPLSEELIFEV